MLKQLVYESGAYIAYSVFSANRARKQMAKDGLKSIVDFDYSSYKTSDTLFFLGSGYSVTDLTDKDWDLIAQHDSIGVNNWVYHPFVPTYFVMETAKYEEQFNHVKESFQLRKEEYKNVPFIIQYQHFVETGFKYDDIGLQPEMIYYNAPYMPRTTSGNVIKRMLRYWNNISPKNFSHLIHYSGSLSYVLMMGAIMGYKEIVLIGVDMNDPRYFFNDEKTTGRAKEFAALHQRLKDQEKAKKQTSQKVYDLADKKFTSAYGSLTFDEYMTYLKPALENEGVSLKIGSEKSKLYPFLDLYPF
tara:strand:+ start:360 stop:1262 length:903 start_codon:yes stop_codon:yes gene_type:complete